MRLKYQMAVQEIAGTYMALATGEDSHCYKNVLKLNATGKIILEMLCQETSEDAIVAELMKRYEGDETLIRSSVSKIIEKFASEGLIA
ncbi:MAG: PqqD family protein [Bacteroidales bacterium]|nr:PqqD family protein [Bacteroidales bacterium]